MATNAGQPLNQAGCVMTLEELFSKIPRPNFSGERIMDWFVDGMNHLSAGEFMQLTLGQAIFTLYMLWCVWETYKDFKEGRLP